MHCWLIRLYTTVPEIAHHSETPQQPRRRALLWLRQQNNSRMSHGARITRKWSLICCNWLFGYEAVDRHDMRHLIAPVSCLFQRISREYTQHRILWHASSCPLIITFWLLGIDASTRKYNHLFPDDATPESLVQDRAGSFHELGKVENNRYYRNAPIHLPRIVVCKLFKYLICHLLLDLLTIIDLSSSLEQHLSSLTRMLTCNKNLEWNMSNSSIS